MDIAFRMILSSMVSAMPFRRACSGQPDAYNHIVGEFPLKAQDVLPLAYRMRVLFTWDLRELCHFIQLRSAKQGHFSYRRIAQQVYAESRASTPRAGALYPRRPC